MLQEDKYRLSRTQSRNQPQRPAVPAAIHREIEQGSLREIPYTPKPPLHYYVIMKRAGDHRNVGPPTGFVQQFWTGCCLRCLLWQISVEREEREDCGQMAALLSPTGSEGCYGNQNFHHRQAQEASDSEENTMARVTSSQCSLTTCDA